MDGSVKNAGTVWDAVETPPWRGALWDLAGDRPALRSVATTGVAGAFADWYHNFDSLGLRVKQRAGIYRVNQLCKEPVILGFLQTALAKARQGWADRPSVLELFCADGYYSCHAKRIGAGRVRGIDLDEGALAQANAVWAALFGEGQPFEKQDVYTYMPAEPVDIVLNCGGLYHLTEPWRLVGGCRGRFGARWMVVQSVVTMERVEDDYFVTPAPGWGHGCRFTEGGLRKQLEAAGWRVVDRHFNELEANERACDRGSAYFLCEWARGEG